MPHGTDIAWCPACGNFPLLTTVKLALSELGIDPKSFVLVSGIGQAAKTPQYVNANMFNGLHGRALPAATVAVLSSLGVLDAEARRELAPWAEPVLHNARGTPVGGLRSVVVLDNHAGGHGAPDAGVPR